MKGSDKTPSALTGFFQSIEALEPVKRILVCVLTLLLVIGVYFWFFYRPQSAAIGKVEKDLNTRKSELVVLKTKAAQIEKFREEMRQTEMQYQLAMEVLPDKDEIPALLSGIARSGSDAGMSFLLFEPKGEVLKEFYAEMPVLMKLTGNYHQAGMFFEKVARLPRIVNLKDITIHHPKSGEPLTTSCTAVTYKFVDMPEPAPEGAAGAKAKAASGKASQKAGKK